MTGRPENVRRDPAEAQEALDVAERRVAKLVGRRNALVGEARTVRAELNLAIEESARLARSPHLTRQAPPQGEGEPA